MSARWNRSPRSRAAISTLSSTPWIEARCAFDMSSGAKRYTAGENRWKWRESVAAIVTYGTAATPGCDAVSASTISANWALSVADSGDGSLDSTTSTLTSGSWMRRLTRRTVCATVSPSAMRRFRVADACEGSTLAAVPPDCIVAATVVRTRAAGSPPSRAKTCAVSGGTAASRRSRCRAGPGVWAANCDSIRVMAFGVRARNVRASRRSRARAMRRTAVSCGGAEAWPPSPRAVSLTVRTPFSPTPTIAARPGTNDSGESTTAPPSSSTSQGVIPFARNDVGDRFRGCAVGLFVAAEREVHVAGGDEPRGEQVLDRLEDDDERTLVVERPTSVHRAVGDAAFEGRVGPGVALVDRYDVVVRHEDERAIGCCAPPRPAEEQSELGVTLEFEGSVRERILLGDERDELVERCATTLVELSRDGRQLDHARESLGDSGAYGRGGHRATISRGPSVVERAKRDETRRGAARLLSSPCRSLSGRSETKRAGLDRPTGWGGRVRTVRGCRRCWG